MHALLISLFVLALFYDWFVLADRYQIFLYNHMAATPFDDRTTSRYWMCGLVASGALTILYTLICWLLGRLAVLRHRVYTPPLWWRVWLLAAIPLACGIPFITMTFNQPTLPPGLAAACVAATLAGLAVALAPGRLAAQHPLELVWLALGGMGLVPVLLLLRVVELPDQGLVNWSTAWAVAVGSLIAGSAWTFVATRLHLRLMQSPWQARHLLVSGLSLSYLLLPLAHHLFFTPPEFRYISLAVNFFPTSPIVQAMSLLVAVAVALVVTRIFSPLRHGVHGDSKY